MLIADTSGVTVEGFVLSSGHCRVSALCPAQSTVSTRGGVGVLGIRADEVMVRGNVIQPGFTSAVDLRATSGAVEQNYASDTAICVVCLTGPSRVEVRTNRLESGLGGVFAASTLANTPFTLGTQASSFDIPQITPSAEPSIDVVIENNLMSGHTRNGGAFGIRLVAYGRDTASIITRQVLTARVHGNRVATDGGGVGASQGLLVDAGFSDRLASTELTGTMFVDVSDNTFTVTGSRIGVMTTRMQSLLSNLSLWKTFGPLKHGTIVVDSDMTYPEDFRIDHFDVDPLSGKTTAGNDCNSDSECSTATYRSQDLPGICNVSSGKCQCPLGLTDVGTICTDMTPLSNVVVVNGQVIPPGVP